jgi:hypothetical protein
VLFPSCDGASVVAVGHDGSRRRLAEGRIALRDVAWFELIGTDGGYVVVPRGDVPAARAHLLRPAPQSSNPHPGPTLAIELVDGGRLPRVDLTMRYTPVLESEAPATIARRLRSAP